MVNSQLSIASQDASRWTGRAIAFCAMLAVGWAYRCDHLTDWDSWDYAAQAIMGHSSDLALGRWWFIAVMRAAYGVGAGLFGLGTAEAFLPMQIVSAAMMAGAVVFGMAWTRRLTGSGAAELLFAAMVVLGPIIGIYAFSVMTEGMTLFFLSLSLWAWEVARGEGLHRGVGAARGEGVSPSPRAGEMPAIRMGGPPMPRCAGLWALAAGLAFGVAVDVREPVLLVAAWPLVSCLVERRAKQWRLLAWLAAGAVITLGIGVVGAWTWYPWKGMSHADAPAWVLGLLPRGMVDANGRLDTSYLTGILHWKEQMDQEQVQYPLHLGSNAIWLFKYAVSGVATAALLAVPAALWAAFRWRRGRWLTVSLVPLAALLLTDHTLNVNPRHPLALVWLLAPLAAFACDRWLAALIKGPRLRLIVGLAVILAGGGAAVAHACYWRVFQEEYFDQMTGKQRCYLAMRQMPDDAVVVSGDGTPAAYFLTRIGEKHFEVIASGWAWPPDVRQKIADRVGAGQAVYVYADFEVWSRSVRKSGEWDILRQEISRYFQVQTLGPYIRLGPLPATLPGPLK